MSSLNTAVTAAPFHNVTHFVFYKLGVSDPSGIVHLLLC